MTKRVELIGYDGATGTVIETITNPHFLPTMPPRVHHTILLDTPLVGWEGRVLTTITLRAERTFPLDS